MFVRQRDAVVQTDQPNPEKKTVSDDLIRKISKQIIREDHAALDRISKS